MATGMSGSHTSYVYAGLAGETAPGRVVKSGLYRMAAGNGGWELLTHGLPEAPAIRAIAIHPNQPELAQFNQDFPASYHNGAGGLSFADGHAEIRRWRDPRTMPPLNRGVSILWPVVPSPHNPDLIWLQQRATALR